MGGKVVNEKNLKVLEQYDFEVKNIRRGRESYVIDTDKGMVILKEYSGSEQRVIWMDQVCRQVIGHGMQADCPLANKDGKFISCDREENRYMVKAWVAGSEIDVRSFSEIKQSVSHLARLHLALTGFSPSEGKTQEKLPWIFEKRMRELRKISRYVRNKKRKNAFELEFMKQYGGFFERCEKAAELSREDTLFEAWERSFGEGCVCHGNYNQHNILKDEGRLAAVCYENSSIGMQSADLYDFMRKMLEKHNWSLELAQEMIQAYVKVRPLESVELKQLYIQFLFSEKFWKVANHYYNSKKTWIPDRSMQKLEKLVEQSRKQSSFLEFFYKNYVG